MQNCNKCWKRPSKVQARAIWRLRHSVVRGSSMDVCCSPCYTSMNHCFSLLTSWILFWALLHCYPGMVL